MNLPRIYKLNKYLVSSAPFLFFAFMPFLAVAEENGSPYGDVLKFSAGIVTYVKKILNRIGKSQNLS
jgi:hypothetical protein